MYVVIDANARLTVMTYKNPVFLFSSFLPFSPLELSGTRGADSFLKIQLTSIPSLPWQSLPRQQLASFMKGHQMPTLRSNDSVLMIRNALLRSDSKCALARILSYDSLTMAIRRFSSTMVTWTWAPEIAGGS